MLGFQPGDSGSIPGFRTLFIVRKLIIVGLSTGHDWYRGIFYQRIIIYKSGLIRSCKTGRIIYWAKNDQYLK